jgi:Ca2+-binding EF-hand superfamily protein
MDNDESVHPVFAFDTPFPDMADELNVVVSKRGLSLVDAVTNEPAADCGWPWHDIVDVYEGPPSDDPTDMDILIFDVADVGKFTFECADSNAVVFAYDRARTGNADSARAGARQSEANEVVVVPEHHVHIRQAFGIVANKTTKTINAKELEVVLALTGLQKLTDEIHFHVGNPETIRFGELHHAIVDCEVTMGFKTTPTTDDSSLEHMYHLRQAFDKVDFGGAGYICPDDLGAVCKHAGVDTTEEQVRSLVTRLPQDASHQLHWSTLLQCILDGILWEVLFCIAHSIESLTQLSSHDTIWAYVLDDPSGVLPARIGISVTPMGCRLIHSETKMLVTQWGWDTLSNFGGIDRPSQDEMERYFIHVMGHGTFLFEVDDYEELHEEFIKKAQTDVANQLREERYQLDVDTFTPEQRYRLELAFAAFAADDDEFDIERFRFMLELVGREDQTDQIFALMDRDTTGGLSVAEFTRQAVEWQEKYKDDPKIISIPGWLALIDAEEAMGFGLVVDLFEPFWSASKVYKEAHQAEYEKLGDKKITKVDMQGFHDFFSDLDLELGDEEVHQTADLLLEAGEADVITWHQLVRGLKAGKMVGTIAEPIFKPLVELRDKNHHLKGKRQMVDQDVANLQTRADVKAALDQKELALQRQVVRANPSGMVNIIKLFKGKKMISEYHIQVDAVLRKNELMEPTGLSLKFDPHNPFWPVVCGQEGPALRSADIKPGDVLLCINDKSIHNLPLESIRQQLDNPFSHGKLLTNITLCRKNEDGRRLKRDPLAMAPDELKKVAMAFDLFDLDGNGTLEPKELRIVLSILERDNIHGAIKELDKNGDGEVSWTEFLIWFRAANNNKHAFNLDKASLNLANFSKFRACFNKHDWAGGCAGVVKRAEIWLVLQEMHTQKLLSNEEAKGITKRLTAPRDAKQQLQHPDVKWIEMAAEINTALIDRRHQQTKDKRAAVLAEQDAAGASDGQFGVNQMLLSSRKHPNVLVGWTLSLPHGGECIVVRTVKEGKGARTAFELKFTKTGKSQVMLLDRKSKDAGNPVHSLPRPQKQGTTMKIFGGGKEMMQPFRVIGPPDDFRVEELPDYDTRIKKTLGKHRINAAEKEMADALAAVEEPEEKDEETLAAEAAQAAADEEARLAEEARLNRVPRPLGTPRERTKGDEVGEKHMSSHKIRKIIDAVANDDAMSGCHYSTAKREVNRRLLEHGVDIKLGENEVKYIKDALKKAKANQLAAAKAGELAKKAEGMADVTPEQHAAMSNRRSRGTGAAARAARAAAAAGENQEAEPAEKKKKKKGGIRFADDDGDTLESVHVIPTRAADNPSQIATEDPTDEEAAAIAAELYSEGEGEGEAGLSFADEAGPEEDYDAHGFEVQDYGTPRTLT